MRILVTGKDGFLGRNIIPAIQSSFKDTIFIGRADCDLEDYRATLAYFKQISPDFVVHCAGKVGGILANKATPADIALINLKIGLNVLEASSSLGVAGVIQFVGSCSYPTAIGRPIVESELNAGRPDDTSIAYATVKTALHFLARAMNIQRGTSNLSLVLGNIYGPYDHFDIVRGHVVPALLVKIIRAKKANMRKLTMIGSGRAQRDLLFAPDVGDVVVDVVGRLSRKDMLPDSMNFSPGIGVSISSLAECIREVVGWDGVFEWEAGSSNDGQITKILDNRLRLGLGINPPFTSLTSGLKLTYDHLMREKLLD